MTKIKRKTISIIGGGFAGLSTASRLILEAEKSSRKISVTLFETKPPTEGGAFNINLPNSFILNHEADFMGFVNVNKSNASTSDFYEWVQEQKNISMSILNGQTIEKKYKNYDLENPKAFLPRSLYGLYLWFRLQDLIKKNRGQNYTFQYRETPVTEIKKIKNGYFVTSKGYKSIFDNVIMCTGCEYYSQNFYTELSNLRIEREKEIGIIGSGISGIELGLALADQNYKNITLFSRNGRIPKVKGISNPYSLKFVTSKNLNSIKNANGYFYFPKFVKLLKNEFEYAYKLAGMGLYQKTGINWKKILENNDPVKQLEEDIKSSQSGKELVWRNVFLALAKIKSLILPYFSPNDELRIFDNFSSLVMSFAAPLPISQGQKLLKNIRSGIIRFEKINSYRKINIGWEVVNGKPVSNQIDFLIEAKGPRMNIEGNPLVLSLLRNGLVEKSQTYGLSVNKNFQSMIKGKTLSTFYLLGSVIKVYAPINNSTVYLNKYINTIIQSIMRNKLET